MFRPEQKRRVTFLRRNTFLLAPVRWKSVTMKRFILQQAHRSIFARFHVRYGSDEPSHVAPTGLPLLPESVPDVVSTVSTNVQRWTGPVEDATQTREEKTAARTHRGKVIVGARVEEMQLAVATDHLSVWSPENTQDSSTYEGL